LAKARSSGARALAVTNDPSGPLAKVADAVVALHAGAERAVPATKTFTAQLTAFALIAEALGPVPWRRPDLDRLPASVGQVLADPDGPEEVASLTGEADRMLAVGRGYLYPIALEAALKVKETSGVLALGYSGADIRHGPLVVVDRGLPVLAFTSSGAAAGDMARLMETLERRGARVFQVCDWEQADLPVSQGLAEPLLAIRMAVQAQQVARVLALRRGLDPDKPPGLSKVTFTD